VIPRRVPAAPGCVVRKRAWHDAIPKKLLLGGRSKVGKGMLGSSEDLEKMYCIQNSDWEVWHNPQMVVWHHIPNNRLQRPYLLRVARSSGLSNYALRNARLHPSQRYFMPLLASLYAVSDAYKLVTYYLKHHQEFEEDISKACEFESRIGRLLSPATMIPQLHQFLVKR